MAQELDLISPNPEKFVSDYVGGVKYKFDEHAGFEKRIKKFEEDSKDSTRIQKTPFFAIFYAV